MSSPGRQPASPDGCPMAEDIPAPAAVPGRARALFLDRDGVINVDHGYTHRIDQFEFVPGIFTLVARARELGFSVVVVTNQAGIGRGYYSEAEFEHLTDWMKQQFALRDAAIDAVYFCPDHPEHGLADYRRDTPMRKPGPGMLLQAAADLNLDLARSVLVGDSETDITAGKRAGLALNVLLHHRGGVPPTTAADVVVHSLDAVPALLN